MRHCAEKAEDLALLAGGDLAGGDEERALRAHVAVCKGCAGFLGELEADQGALSGLSLIEAEGDESLATDVLRRLGMTESARPAAPSAEAAARTAHALRAVAAAVVVVAALGSVLALEGPFQTLLKGSAPLADALDGDPSLTGGTPGVRAESDGLPIRIRRAGAGLELEWTGDGREQVAPGPATTYRVVASAFPNDFDGGRSVEVAGERLVASGVPFPARRIGDRDLTFFRVD